MEGSLVLQEWGAAWREWGGKGTRCWHGDQERQYTFYWLPQLPVVLNCVKSHPTCPYICDLLWRMLFAVTGCTRPHPPGATFHLPQPMRQNQCWLSSPMALPALHRSFVLWLHLPHSRRGDSSEGKANAKLDNSRETFCGNEDLGRSDTVTRIHKGIKLRRHPMKQLWDPQQFQSLPTFQECFLLGLICL